MTYLTKFLIFSCQLFSVDLIIVINALLLLEFALNNYSKDERNKNSSKIDIEVSIYFWFDSIWEFLNHFNFIREVSSEHWNSSYKNVGSEESSSKDKNLVEEFPGKVGTN